MDPHSKKDVRKAREDAKAAQREQDEFLREVLGLAQGRRYFWALLATCGVGRNPFATDPLTTAFTCGELNIGQRIQSEIIRVAPERYIQMMGEQSGRNYNTSDSDADDGDPGESGGA